MADFVKVATVKEIPSGTMKPFEIGHDRFVLCHTDDGFFAVEDTCTHDNEPISNGELRDHEVVCPRHGARFDIRDGSVKAPPALVPLETYEVKVEGEDIYVRLG